MTKLGREIARDELAAEARNAAIERLEPTTRDIGLSIRDALEHLTHITVWRDDEHGDDTEAGKVEIFDVDASDANNLVIELASGQSFVVRIVASHHRR